MNPAMGAAHKRRLIFQMVRTACAPVQQLRPKAQGNTYGKGQNLGEEVKGIRTGRVIVLVGIGYTATQGLSSVEFSKD